MTKSTTTFAVSAVQPGRPTRGQARARHAALLECAFDHFLERGFEQATIEAIAADMSMTKRTVYARYPSKTDLFHAAVQRGIESYAPSQDRIAAICADTIEQTLVNIAKLRVELIQTSNGMKLQRVINTESFRFPEIFTMYYKLAIRPTVRYLADLLQRETDAGRLAIDDPRMAARVFMSMVVGGPARFIISGFTLDEDELDTRILFSVRLFLSGARPR